MEAAGVPALTFDHLREHSIGLPQVLFQSITHMAPGAAVAYSIYISGPFSKQALALSGLLALIACLCAAVAIGQLARLEPSAGGLYTYAARSLGPAAGFIVAWLFILFEPLVAPFLYLEFGWAMREVMGSEAGWHYTGQWWIWATLMTVIVFLLTLRDIRLSTTVGVILGAFEIAVFAALAIWMLLSNTGDLNLAPFTVVGSALAIGLFYVLTAYAWVFGAGFDNFVNQATGADPWRNLGKIFWSTGWIVVFLAICNSIAANSNAAVNAATRVFYALARNRLAPRPLGRTHPRFKTPHVAIIWMSAFALVISFALGCIWHYWTKRRAEFNPLLHFVLPAAGAVLFFFPLYYEYVKFPPTYPIKYANWIAIGWVVAGVALTIWLWATAPDRLRDMERVYVEDETVAPEGASAAPAVT